MKNEWSYASAPLIHHRGGDKEKFVIKIVLYEGESNENLKSAIKIPNTVRLSFKLTTVMLMV